MARWVAARAFAPGEVDCAITVMLKILDGKCRMAPEEKRVMALLYAATRALPAQRFGAAAHALIAEGCEREDEAFRLMIYERRVLAESMLSRPVMKAFKARIRREGLFDLPVAA
ncbi:hypothetical protein G3580_18740 [Nitrogeniibacter mangrovi]|uniref:Uncharacterized protein n=1 Tax=Nitrogeniibacter mangrovi TaxID=2016596 RepID=A0A6C1B982_9RHOO|nr:hypothetical protein G3580_18740 [Nitrogeniibacter mangrovi]